MQLLLYAFVMFGVIGFGFGVYSLVMIGCGESSHQLSLQGLSSTADHRSSVSLNMNPYSTSTFKYKEGIESSEVRPESECIVCLSRFQDDEDVRQLSRCRHSFHAPCIDMWLYSHSDCPLCRTPIRRPESENRVLIIENSMDGLRDTRISP